MKIAILAALVGSAAAFAPAATLPSRTSRLLAAAATKEAAAKSAEEDIELTLKVIMSSMTDDDGAGVDDSDVDDESAADPAAAATEVAPAAAVAVKVLMKASAPKALASRPEPALKPNQPIHSSEAPIRTDAERNGVTRITRRQSARSRKRATSLPRRDSRFDWQKINTG